MLLRPLVRKTLKNIHRIVGIQPRFHLLSHLIPSRHSFPLKLFNLSSRARVFPLSVSSLVDIVSGICNASRREISSHTASNQGSTAR
jgi:hypothetical protein